MGRCASEGVFVFQTIQKVENMVVANNQQTLYDHSITIVQQNNPEMAKLLMEANQYQQAETRAIIQDLTEQLTDFYTQPAAAKPEIKKGLIDRARDLLDIGERIGATAPGLINLGTKLMEAIQQLSP